MSLHYCWLTRALNNFCVTQSINLPSLCGWKHCQRGAPAPKVNTGLAAASSSGKHHSNGPGEGHTWGSLRTCQAWLRLKEPEHSAVSQSAIVWCDTSAAYARPESQRVWVGGGCRRGGGGRKAGGYPHTLRFFLSTPSGGWPPSSYCGWWSD